ncbi:hypothetical protein GCM10011359_28870 [Nesterenkonia alkaliphila]|nr:hypothetical protein GCM10011359_28870 [Nesterenkonia alkaliphila]
MAIATRPVLNLAQGESSQNLPAAVHAVKQMGISEFREQLRIRRATSTHEWTQTRSAEIDQWAEQAANALRALPSSS